MYAIKLKSLKPEDDIETFHSDPPDNHMDEV